MLPQHEAVNRYLIWRDSMLILEKVSDVIAADPLTKYDFDTRTECIN
jgi:hypothetical protein